MEKSRWNKDLKEWIKEQFYTKDEVDKIQNLTLNEVEVTIVYENNTSETKIFYVKGD